MTPSEKIGLIAGNGSFPLLFARAAKAKGMSVVAVAMRGETKTEINDLVDQITWVRVGQLSKMIRAFRSAGITKAAMAGGIRKTRLFGGARPDLLTLRLLTRNAIRRDDGILRAVAAEFEKEGIEIVDSTLVMPEVLAPSGLLTNRKPDARESADLKYGLGIALKIGELDIGQTVIVKDGAVVALEAIEGTDLCIQRAGELSGGGAVMVKVAKPGQDMRFDVPAIGPKTIDSLRKAGIRVLGIEAGRTLLLEGDILLKRAEESGISVVGLDSTLDPISDPI